jgi:hypothetical protein
MSRLDDRLVEVFTYAARIPPVAVLRKTNTLQLMAAQEMFPDADLPAYLPWEEIQRGWTMLLDRFWQPFTDDRASAIDAVDDWRLSPGLCDSLTEILMGSVERIIRSDGARQWLLLCRLHVSCGMLLPAGHQVFGRTMQRIGDANGPAALPTEYRIILSEANHVSLNSVLGKHFAGHLPPGEHQEAYVHLRTHTARSQVRGLLGSLLDDTLMRLADWENHPS